MCLMVSTSYRMYVVMNTANIFKTQLSEVIPVCRRIMYSFFVASVFDIFIVGVLDVQ